MNHNALNLLDANEQVISFAKNFSPLILGRIAEHHKDRYIILTENKRIPARVSGKWIYKSQDPKAFPTVGDFVLADINSDIAIIQKLVPRTSLIERKVAGNRTDGQIHAANVDYIFICQSVNDNFNKRRLERYLSMAWSSGAIPIILLTKSDLTHDIKSYIYEASTVALGVDVLTCSLHTPGGFDELDAYLKPSRTYVFMGSSGVGKSTVINHLLGSQTLLTQEIGYLDRGRHTTTSRSLFTTKTGAILIDTPGMRELQLDQADFDTSFQDIMMLSKSCKFNDCTHHNEPGCAVLDSIDNGLLDPERLHNYHKMQKELVYVESRQKYLERMRNKTLRK